MKASVLKTFKSVIKYHIDPFHQGIVHLFQEVVTGVAPLCDGPRDKSLCHGERAVIRKFSCSSPVKEWMVMKGR